MPCADEIELPGLHDAADRASQSAQRRYLALIRINLIALITGSLAAILAPTEDSFGRTIAGLGAIALFTALGTTFIIQNKSYERTWYGGRAVAESVKTLAWRYMTRAEPFTDDAFLDRLKEILAHGATLNVKVSGTGADQITKRMRDMRDSSLETRRELYARCRIADQRDWYAGKATANERAENKFFVAMLLADGLAVIAAVAHIIWPMFVVNPTGMFATIAAAVLAWLQVRRHQELAQSYAIAAQELAIIHGKAEHIESEEELATFVADAENAISREHTLWVARRDAGIAIAKKA